MHGGDSARGLGESMMARRSSGPKRGAEIDPGPDLFTAAAERENARLAIERAKPKPRPPMEPLLVALSPETFRWFAECGRRWEVRRYGREFIERFVFAGRAVELRRGRRPDEALKGAIARVILADDLPALFDQIPYREVVPDAASVEEAIEVAGPALGVGRAGIIAVEINLDYENAQTPTGRVIQQRRRPRRQLIRRPARCSRPGWFRRPPAAASASRAYPRLRPGRRRAGCCSAPCR